MSAIACWLLVVRIPLASPLSNYLLIPRFLPWFLMGIGFHALAQRTDRPLGALLISIGTLESLALSMAGIPDAVPIGVVLAVPILFAAAIWLGPCARLLATRLMARVGLASYGLYLLHQNVGVAILHSLPPMKAAGGAIAVMAVAAGCTAVAVASFRCIETPFSRVIRATLLPTGARARRDAAGYAPFAGDGR